MSPVLSEEQEFAVAALFSEIGRRLHRAGDAVAGYAPLELLARIPGRFRLTPVKLILPFGIDLAFYTEIREDTQVNKPCHWRSLF